MEPKLASAQTLAEKATEECEVGFYFDMLPLVEYSLGSRPSIFFSGFRETVYDSAVPLDGFLDEFLRKSSEAYVRQIKADKFQHYVEAELSSPSTTTSPSRPRNINNYF